VRFVAKSCGIRKRPHHLRDGVGAAGKYVVYRLFGKTVFDQRFAGFDLHVFDSLTSPFKLLVLGEEIALLFVELFEVITVAKWCYRVCISGRVVVELF
jgi:hypothetical protein